MESVMNTNSSKKNNKSSPMNKNNKKNIYNDYHSQQNINNNTNKNRVSREKESPNYRIINLKQKLEDQILFPNERKNSFLKTNFSQVERVSKSKQRENNILNSTYSNNITSLNRASKEKHQANSSNMAQKLNIYKNPTRSNSNQKNSDQNTKKFNSNLSTINMNRFENNINNNDHHYNINATANFNNRKELDKNNTYHFDKELTRINNFITKPNEINQTTHSFIHNERKNISNSKFKRPFKILEDIKTKIDELNITTNIDEQINNKTLQNFSKSKHLLNNMLENLREELFDISKTVNNFTASRQDHKNRTHSNEKALDNKQQSISDIIVNLQAKNDELNKQLLSFKEKFVDINLENVDLRNKLKNFNQANIPTSSGNNEINYDKLKKLKSSSKDKTLDNTAINNYQKINNSPTIISLNLKTQGNNNIEAIKKLAEKLKEKEIEISEMDDKIKNITIEYKNAEKNLLRAENKAESLQNIISEVLAKSKNDQKTIETLRKQLATINASSKENITPCNNKSNLDNPILSTENNLNNITNYTGNFKFDYKNQEILIHLNYKINKQNDFILISDADQFKYTWINLYNKEMNIFSEAIDYYNNLYNEILNNNNFDEEMEGYDKILDYITDFSNNHNYTSINTTSKNYKINNNNKFKKMRLIYKNLNLELENNLGFNNIKPVYLPIEDTKEYLTQANKFNILNFSSNNNHRLNNNSPGIPPKSGTKVDVNLINIKDTEIEKLKLEKIELEKDFNEKKNYLISEADNREGIIANLKVDLEKLLNDNSLFLENIEKLNAELEEKNNTIEELIKYNKELEADNETLKIDNLKLSDKFNDNNHYENSLKNEISKLRLTNENEIKNYQNLLQKTQYDLENLIKEKNVSLENLNNIIKQLNEEKIQTKKEFENIKLSEYKKIKDLQAILENNNKDLHSKEDELNKLNTEILILIKENKEKVQELIRCKAEIENIHKFEKEKNEKIILLNKSVSDKQAEVSSINIQLQELQNKYAEKCKNYEKIEKELNLLKQQAFDKEKQIQTQSNNVNNTLISFNKQISDYIAQIKNLEDENYDIKTEQIKEKENFTRTIDQKLKIIDSLKKENTENEISIKHIKENELKNKDIIQKLNEEKHQCEAEVFKLKEQIISLNDLLVNSDKIIKENDNRMNKEKEELLKNKKLADEKISSLKKENEELKVAHQNLLQKTEGDGNKKNKEITSLKELLEAKNQEVNIIKEELKNYKNLEASKNQSNKQIELLMNENKRLENEINDLKREIQNLNVKNQKLNEDIHNLKTQISDYEKNEFDKNEQIYSLSYREDELARQCEELDNKNSNKDYQIKQLSQEINELKKQNNENKTQISNLNDQIGNLNNTIKDHKNKVNNADLELKIANDELINLSGTTKEQADKIKNYESDLSKIDQLLKKTQNELKDKNIEIKNMNNDITDKDEQIRLMQAALDFKNANLHENKKANNDVQNTELTNLIQESEDRFSQLDNENGELEELIVNYAQEIEVLKNNYSNLEKFQYDNIQLLSINQIQEKLLNNKISEIENINKQKNVSDKNLQETKESLNALLKDKKDLEANYKKLLDDFENLKSQISHTENVSQSFETLKEENFKLKKENKELRKKESELQTKSEELEKSYINLKEEFDNKLESLLQMTDLIENYEQKVSILEKEIEKHNELNLSLQNELETRDNALNELNDLINEKIAMLGNYEEENEALKKEIEKLKFSVNPLSDREANNTPSNKFSQKVPNNQYIKSENTYDSILVTEENKNKTINTDPNHDNTISKYEDKIERLNKTNLELNNQIILLTKELQKGSSGDGLKNKDFPNLLTGNKELEQEKNNNAILQEQNQNLQLENNQIKGLISDYEKCIEELQEKIANFTNDVNQNHSELEEKIQEKDYEIHTLEEKLNTYEMAINEYEEKEKYFLREMEKLIEEKTQKEQELEHYLLDAKNENQTIKEKMNENIKNETDKLNNDLKKLKSLINDKDKEILGLKDKIDIYKNKLSEVENKTNRTDLNSNQASNDHETAEVYIEQIENLKRLIMDKDERIEELKREIDTVKLEHEKYLRTNDDDNKSKLSFNMSSLGNTEGNDERKLAEKLEKYKNAAQNLKQNNDLLITQMSVLKDEIKSQKLKNEQLLSFDGRIKDYEEFKDLFRQVSDNYKPKKKEQEDALKKLKEHLLINMNNEGTINLLTDNSSVNPEKKKGGLLGFFSKKK